MDAVRPRPGPVAAQAFRLGMYLGAFVGLAVIGLLYWAGSLGVVMAGYALLLLFPVYLVFVAAVLSRWLGYQKGTESLRPVYETR